MKKIVFFVSFKIFGIDGVRQGGEMHTLTDIVDDESVYKYIRDDMIRKTRKLIAKKYEADIGDVVIVNISKLYEVKENEDD